MNHAASHSCRLHKGFSLCAHRCMGATPRSWVCMPRKRQPAYGMEGCEMDCGGTPASGVELQTCWSARRVPVQRVRVSVAQWASLVLEVSTHPACVQTAEHLHRRRCRLHVTDVSSKALLGVGPLLPARVLVSACVFSLVRAELWSELSDCFYVSSSQMTADKGVAPQESSTSDGRLQQ